MLDLTPLQTPFSSVAVGAGVWVFALWAWLSTEEQRRVETAAAFGVVVAAAFAVGAIPSLWQDSLALSSVGAGIGAVGALAGFWLLSDRSDPELFDRLVPAGIAGLSVARVGCLFDGCDFGRVTEAVPAVIYGPDTRAWQMHVVEYGLSPGSDASLPVLPFAAYLALWGLFAAGVGQWWRRRDGRGGEPAFVAALVFLVGAGGIEWLRDPAMVPGFVDAISVLPFVYWTAACIVTVGWWSLRRSNGSEQL